MPNHTPNNCMFEGPKGRIQEFLKTHFVPGEKGEIEFDFNTVIPQPEVLKGTVSGSSSGDGIYIITGKSSRMFFGYTETPTELRQKLESQGRLEEALKEGQKCLDAFEQTGFYDWYAWSNANWGTKWNAYDLNLQEIEDLPEDQAKLEFYFETAWAPPIPIFTKLAEMYPDLIGNVYYADEGGGFAGRIVLRSGVLIDVPLDDEATKEDWREARAHAYGYDIDGEDDEEDEEEETE